MSKLKLVCKLNVAVYTLVHQSFLLGKGTLVTVPEPRGSLPWD